MMSREELEKHLSVLRTEEILRLLRDDTLLELANTYFASLGMRSKQNEAKDASMDTSPSSFMNQQSGEPSPDKAKRPLNAFMAFRSEISSISCYLLFLPSYYLLLLDLSYLLLSTVPLSYYLLT